jgi:short-subunit dehydrogenase
MTQRNRSVPRSILITGATGAIGSALALEYAAPGRTLVLLGRDSSKLAELARRCEQLGATAQSSVVDLGAQKDLDAWLEGLALAPPPDLVVLNAGVTSHIGAHGEGESWDAIATVLDINLKASIAVIQALLPAMRRRGSGQIALISSLSAYFGLPLTPAYCASKAGLKSYGEALRGWLAPQGIAVNVVMPGFVASAMSDQFPAPKPFMLSPQQAARLIRRGLERDRARIAFPWPLRLGMWWLAVLPPDLSLLLLRLSGYGVKRRQPD